VDVEEVVPHLIERLRDRERVLDEHGRSLASRYRCSHG
jgi:hypothetical protein